MFKLSLCPFPLRLLFLFLLTGWLASCQSSAVSSTAEGFDSECIDLASRFREQAKNEQVSNAISVPLADLPLLHVNRFLESLAAEVTDSDQAQVWTQQAARLAIEARHAENLNFEQPWSELSMNELASCSLDAAQASTYESARLTIISQLTEETIVKDDYRAVQKWLGFYALLKPIFAARIHSLHEDERQWFAEEEFFEQSGGYDLDGERSSLSTVEIEAMLDQATNANSLRLPLLEDQQLNTLFRHYAPRMEIEYTGIADELGMPTWQNGEMLIDTQQVAAYVLPSYTRFNGQNLLQLNFVFWFPERSPVGFIDLYSGEIDSLIWRVTLDDRGQVLLYDSIHSCGCYHKFFVGSEKLAVKAIAESREPANIFDVAYLDSTQPVRLILSSNEHYIVGLDNETSANLKRYGLQPYSLLSQLPEADGHRSMFDDRGLIPVSKRLERFTLWPTGIESVGAMRQWGRHATGFVEQQHFDDARLLDKYFRFTD